MSIRMFKEQSKPQGVDEEVAYKIDTKPWGGSPSNLRVTIALAGEDISEDHLEGDPTIVGDIVTTSLVHSLLAGKRYRLDVKWNCQSNTFEAFGHLIGEE